MKHISHRMHEHSLWSHAAVDLSGRAAEVCAVLRRRGEAMTDREVCTALGSQDLNHVRPSISQLINDDGVLAEVGKVTCPTTGRTVRKVWFK
jgi:hypothetical protein